MNSISEFPSLDMPTSERLFFQVGFLVISPGSFGFEALWTSHAFVRFGRVVGLEVFQPRGREAKSFWTLIARERPLARVHAHMNGPTAFLPKSCLANFAFKGFFSGVDSVMVS